MKVNVLGIKIDNVTMPEAVEMVTGMIKAGKKGYVVTPNPEIVMAAQQDGELARIINQADLVIADGIGLVWASKLGVRSQGSGVREQQLDQNITQSDQPFALRQRVTGIDLMEKLCEKASDLGFTIGLLGGGPKIADRCAQVLRKRYPKLKISFVYEGNGGKDGDEAIARQFRLQVSKQTTDYLASPRLRRASGLPSTAVVSSQPASPKALQRGEKSMDLLFVAFGFSKQEKWMARNLDRIPVTVAMGVGGAFDVIAGKVKRAPQIIQKLGLEWLWRLAREPWRAKRQLALLKFAVSVLKAIYQKPNFDT